MCVILHEQCKLILKEESLTNGVKMLLEVDPDEQSELRGMTVNHFRDSEEDFFLQVFYILGSVYPE